MGGTGELVFVYGTLRRGASNHWRMEDAEWVGDAWVLGHLYPIDWYPGMVLDGDGVPVRGELYRVDAALLERLDEFEGVTGEGEDEYARVKTEVQQKTGPAMDAWVWEYRREVRKRKEIMPADWVNPPPEKRFPVFGLLSVAVTVGGFVALGMWQRTWLWHDAPDWLRVAVVPVLHVAMVGLFANAAQWRNERWWSVSWIAFAVVWILGLGFGLYEL